MYKIKQIPEDFIVEEIPLLNLNKEGEYSYYTLEKKELNSEHVINNLSKRFRIPRKNFGYAGNKDKKAITFQYFSVKGDIKETSNDNFKIKFIGKGDSPISLGDLKGNKFKVTIRNISSKPEKIDFIVNYFDEQRFGENNLETGLSIIKKDFKKAAKLQELNVENNDYIGALRKLPFKTLMLFLHAFQSYIWNEAAAEYIKTKCNDYCIVKYKLGEFLFPKEKIKNIDLPLISFDTEFSDETIKDIYQRLLKKFNINLRDLVTRQLPGLTPMGDSRRLIADIRDLKIGELEDDELNKDMKKTKISFELGKGSYATVVIKNIIKN